VLFDGIPLDKVSTSMTINAPAAILLAMYIDSGATSRACPRPAARHRAERHPQGVHRARHVHLPAAPVDAPDHRHLRLAPGRSPNWNTISISGYHIREAGSTAAQEIAFTLANGIAYVRQALDGRGWTWTFGRSSRFFFNAHNHFFEEVAKFRAARRLWARIMRERFGARTPKLDAALPHPDRRQHAHGAAAENNIVRTTLQALAAVLGGTQSLHTNSFDEALALPTEKSGQAGRAAHAADHRPRERRGRHARPAGGQLQRRAAATTSCRC
jgi:methylmalonyl-CoA mutase, N-terminal domain